MSAKIKRDKLRAVIFKPYRKGMGPTFSLVVWDTHTEDEYRKKVLCYRLTMHDKYAGPGCSPSYHTVLFEGEDFCCSPMHAISSDQMVESLMSFLTLRQEDVDEEYFANYTPEQLEFCSHHAESLAVEVSARFGGGE